MSSPIPGGGCSPREALRYALPMRRTPRLLLGLLGLTACTPAPIKIELEPAAGHQSALLVVLAENAPLTTARVFATSLADFHGLPPSSVTEGERIHLYVALYDRSLESLHLRPGELNLSSEDTPHYTWPPAVETLTAQVDVGQPAVVRLTPVDPSPLSGLNLRAECPEEELQLGAEPIDLPARCAFRLPARPQVCYGTFHPWSGPSGPIKPGAAVLDAEGRTWLYYSQALPGTSLAARLFRIQLVSPSVADPATLEDLGLPEPAVSTDRGVLQAPGVRRGQLELFATWGNRDGTSLEDARIFLAARPAASSPFSSLQELSELHRLSGGIFDPLLLPDARTLVYRHESRQGLSFARRPTTQAGDAAFADIKQVVLDSYASSLSLSCDGGHVLYSVRRTSGAEARAARIVQLDPVEVGPSQVLSAPKLPSSTTRFIEGPRCEALYAYGGATLLVAEAEPCPSECAENPAACSVCGDGVRRGAEACDGQDLGGQDCTVVAPGAVGTLSCTPECAFDTHACTPSFFNGNGAGLEPGAPWPMFRGGPAHTAQTSIVGPHALVTKWDYAGVGGEGAGGIVVSAGGRIIYGTDAGRVHAVEPTGARAWMVQLPGQIMGSPALARDGTIYVSTNQGALHALAPSDGAQRWRFLAGRGGQTRGSPTVAPDGTIYHAFPSGLLHAINPDGTGRWSVMLGIGGGYAAGASPALGLDGTIYAPEISNDPVKLFAITPAGEIRWTVPVDKTLEASAVVMPSGDILFGGRRIAPDGTVVGRIPFGPWGVSLGPGDRMYSGTGGVLLALPLGVGTGWAVAGPTNGVPPPLVGGAGLVYVAGWDPNWAFVVNASGSLVSQDSESRGLDTPAIGADGTLYAAHGNGIRAYQR